jgi:hypothetical protein
MSFIPTNVNNGLLRLNSTGKVASGQLGSNLADINGITSPTTGYVIKWDGTNWVAASVPAPAQVVTPVGDGDLTSGAFTLTSSNAEHIIEVNTSVATQINLPALSTMVEGGKITIKRRGAGAVTVDGNSSETIDGAASFVLAAQYEAATLYVSDSSAEWARI